MVSTNTLNLFMGNWQAVNNQQITSGQFTLARLVQFGASEAVFSLANINASPLGNRSYPDAMFLVGGLPIPLYELQYFELGRSQDLLQYRAVGGEFLAQQKGGNVAVRIDMILHGSMQDHILSILQGVYLWTRGETTYKKWSENAGEQSLNNAYESENVNIKTTAPVLPGSLIGLFGIMPLAGAQKTVLKKAITSEANRGTNITNPKYKTQTLKSSVASGGTNYNIDANLQRTIHHIDKVDTEAHLQYEAAKNNNMTLVDPDDYSWAREDWHRTFTLTTREEMLFDMYIETISYRRSLLKGSKVIEVNLFLRHFNPPDQYQNLPTSFKPYTKTGKGGSGPVITVDSTLGFKRALIKRKRVGVYHTANGPLTKEDSIDNLLYGKDWVLELGLSTLHRTLTNVFRYGFSGGYQQYKDRQILNQGIGASIYNYVTSSLSTSKTTDILGDI